ncbi:serine hydrolase [Bellilinea sp.]|uniref:serine hydrolase n=1 Tax=Bellilinea sp. TaxID=2838785 RepID=UPI002ADE3828|nr:serine hydrolase [Bellilinea sp.]
MQRYNYSMYHTPFLAEINTLNIQFAFYFQRNASAPLQAGNAQRFPAASIIKIPILLAWVLLERQGEVSQREICHLDDEPEVHGAGFSWLLQARHLPYHDVLLMMMALSDNLCTNLIIRRIGLERLNHLFRQEMGLTGTQLQRKLMDFEARKKGLDNWISADDCIRYFDLFENLNAAEKGWVEPMLLVNQDDLLLKRDLPRDEVDFYHKTGSIPGVLHDWGYTRTCRIFLLTSGATDETVLYPIFGKAGQLLLEN